MTSLELDAAPVAAAQEWVAGDPNDRRKEPRYKPLTDGAYLGWWEGSTFRTEPGRLLNISVGGAALDLPVVAEGLETVFLCPIGSGALDWVPARLLGREGSVMRMEFAERLPYEQFKAVVWGLPAERAAAPDGVLSA